METTKNKYLDWIVNNQQTLKISEINDAAGLPVSTLAKWLNGTRPLPEKYIPNLERYVKRFIKPVL